MTIWNYNKHIKIEIVIVNELRMKNIGFKKLR